MTITYYRENGILASLTFDPAIAKPGLLVPFSCSLQGPQWWVLDVDWIYWDGKRVMRVRRGFGWDGASIPWVVQWYEKPGAHLAASCPHDNIYTYHWIEVWNEVKQEWVPTYASKSFADSLFHDVNERVYNIRHIKSSVLYGFVHAFGYLSWHTNICRSKCYKCAGICSIDCPFKNKLPKNSEFDSKTL
jgi:hypothetical protein